MAEKAKSKEPKESEQQEQKSIKASPASYPRFLYHKKLGAKLFVSEADEKDLKIDEWFDSPAKHGAPDSHPAAEAKIEG